MWRLEDSLGYHSQEIVYVYVCSCAFVCVCMCVHPRMPACMCVYMQVYVYVCMYVYVYACVRVCDVGSHVYVGTHVWRLENSLGCHSQECHSPPLRQNPSLMRTHSLD